MPRSPSSGNPRLAVGVDLGATRVRVCVGTSGGKLLWRDSAVMHVPRSVNRYVKGLVAAVQGAVDHAPAGATLEGIGVGSLGPLVPARGGIRPANLPYGFIPIVGPIEDATGLRVALTNDAKVAALGEWRFGAGRGHRNLVYVTLSTGIGGGVVVDGRLLNGKEGNAGEVGHMVVDADGRMKCGCGAPGHWEAYCSGKNIPTFARLLARLHPEGAWKAASSAQLFSAAAAGDRFARLVVAEVGRLNAIGIANLVDAYDPSMVTIGGAVALANPSAILDPVRRLAPSFAINRVPDIRITPLGDDAGLLGALALVFETPAGPR